MAAGHITGGIFGNHEAGALFGRVSAKLALAHILGIEPQRHGGGGVIRAPEERRELAGARALGIGRHLVDQDGGPPIGIMACDDTADGLGRAGAGVCHRLSSLTPDRGLFLLCLTNLAWLGRGANPPQAHERQLTSGGLCLYMRTNEFGQR